MLPDDLKPFHVVCDASDFAFGCALMQFDNEGHERVMKPAERNYSVHDKELLAMRYALIKFRVYLLGELAFAVYTDHASLRTAMKPPHLSQRMAHWLSSFFVEYNFVNNILADALSRRPDYNPPVVLGRQVIDGEDDGDDHCAVCAASGINLTSVSPEMDLRDEIVAAYTNDAVYANILAYLRSPNDETLGALSRNTRNQIDRYGELLYYNIDRFDAPRVVAPNDDDLRARIIHEFHDSPTGAHLSREKTLAAISRDFYWPRMYKWVRKNILAYLRSPNDETLGALSRNTRNQIDRYGELLYYNIDRFDAPRVVAPNDDDLRARIIHEFHDSPTGAHLSREKTLAAISRDFYWPRMYKWVRKWVRTCETCQRVKPSKSSQAPLHPLPIATEPWRSVSMDFVFGLPPDADGRNGVLVFVDRFTKTDHLTPVKDTVTAAETAAHFVDCVFRHHGLPESIVSDRDPRFTSAYWTALFHLLGTKLSMSTAAHPETDGQTERVNRSSKMFFGVTQLLSKFLPLAEFALNNAEHASTGLTPFFANNARHPRVPALLAVGHPTCLVPPLWVGTMTTSGAHDPETLYAVTRSKAKQALATPGPAASPLAAWTARTLIDPGNTGPQVAANYAPKSPSRQVDNAAVSAFVQRRASIARFVRDALQDAVDKQKENADKRGRKNMATFRIGEKVLLSTDGIRSSAVTNLGASKLAPRIIGPFRVVKVNGEAYTLDIPTSLRLHPTLFVGRLTKYHPAAIPSTLDPTAAPAHRANAPPGVPSAPLTAEAASPSAVLQRRESPALESAPVTPDSSDAPLQGPSESPRSAQSPPQFPPERPEHDSLLSPNPPGTPTRKP
ncbi:Polyprotein, partial [Phytophthora palmivora]